MALVAESQLAARCTTAQAARSMNEIKDIEFISVQFSLSPTIVDECIPFRLVQSSFFSPLMISCG